MNEPAPARPDTGSSPARSRPGPALGRLARWLRSVPLQLRRSAACRACGRCCELFGGHLQASKADLERWRREGRSELLARVGRLGWLWMDPDSGKPLQACPFLVRESPEAAHCGIHETKPEMCRAYPTLAHHGRCVRGLQIH